MQSTILNKMAQMKLLGMHQAYKTLLDNNQHHGLDAQEMIEMLVQAEWEDKENRKINRLLRMARFRYQASVEEVDFTASRQLDKNQFLRLADTSFIKRKENILITGATGVGKSYLASALGHQACMEGYKTLYYNTQKLFSKLKMMKADDSYVKEIKRIERQDLFVLDDFGLQPLDAASRMMLLEIIEDRHGKSSTLISSQLPVNQWYEIIGDGTIADAILDRMVNGSHRIQLKGESLRKKK